MWDHRAGPCRAGRLLGILLLLGAWAVFVQPATAQPGPVRTVGPRAGGAKGRLPKQPELVVRVYNVADLVLVGRDYPFTSSVRPLGWDLRQPEPKPRYGGGGYFDGPDETPPSKPAARRDVLTVEILAGLVQQMLVTDSRWAGGPVVQPVGKCLVVRQTPAGQEMVENLLGQLREEMAHRRTICVRARWITLDAAQRGKLLGGADATPTWPLTVTEKALRAAGGTVAYRAVTTGLDAQIVSTACGDAQHLVTGLEPVVAEVAAAFRPVVEKVLWGAVLEVCPLLIDDGRQARLIVRSAVSELKQLHKHPIRFLPDVRAEHTIYSRPKDGPEGTLKSRKVIGTAIPATLELDAPEYTMHWLRTCVTIPVGRPVLIGGMTPPKGKGGDKLTYLVLEVLPQKEKGR